MLASPCMFPNTDPKSGFMRGISRITRLEVCELEDRQYAGESCNMGIWMTVEPIASTRSRWLLPCMKKLRQSGRYATIRTDIERDSEH